MPPADRAERTDALLVCGGRYHDFDFARLQILTLLAEHDHVRTTVWSDYRDLAALAQADCLVTYTCDVRPTPAEQAALAQFVRNGGRWFALHGTNSVLERTPDGMATPALLGEVAIVLGSQFQSHPDIAPYRVDVVAPEHPLVHGIESFTVEEDELYLCTLHDPETHTVLLSTEWSGTTRPGGFLNRDWTAARARPVMYLRPFGQGEVLYLTLGHCRGHYDMQPEVDYWPRVERGAWNIPQFAELVRRGIRWALGEAQDQPVSLSYTGRAKR